MNYIITESQYNKLIESKLEIPTSIRRRYEFDVKKLNRELNKIYKEYVKFRYEGFPHEEMMDNEDPNFGLMIYHFIIKVFNIDIYVGPLTVERFEDYNILYTFVDSYLLSRYNEENK